MRWCLFCQGKGGLSCRDLIGATISVVLARDHGARVTWPTCAKQSKGSPPQKLLSFDHIANHRWFSSNTSLHSLHCISLSFYLVHIEEGFTISEFSNQTNVELHSSAIKSSARGFEWRGEPLLAWTRLLHLEAGTAMLNPWHWFLLTICFDVESIVREQGAKEFLRCHNISTRMIRRHLHHAACVRIVLAL